MTRYLIVIVLVGSFSLPALAANRQYDRASPDDCRIVNIAPSYAQTTIQRMLDCCKQERNGHIDQPGKFIVIRIVLRSVAFTFLFLGLPNVAGAGR